jgi:hypothetical protein
LVAVGGMGSWGRALGWVSGGVGGWAEVWPVDRVRHAVCQGSAGYFQLDHATGMFAYSTNNVAREAFFPSAPSAGTAHDLKLLVAGGVPS